MVRKAPLAALGGVACLLACLALASPTWAEPSADAVATRRAALQQRGAEALKQERARSKADLCAHALDGSVPAVGNCWVREGKITEAGYTAYTRAIGALLRLPPPSLRPTPLPTGPPQPLAFDKAEATWRAYRQQTCDAMTIQWEGGDMGRIAYPKCLLTVTWDHMNELADLYTGLWGE